MAALTVSELFPSRYIKAADLKDHEVEVKMDFVEMQVFDDGDKPGLFFEGREKALILNLTNTKRIASAYGDDTAEWHSQPIILYPDVTEFQGRTVPCIRVRIPVPPATVGDEGEDDIPF